LAGIENANINAGLRFNEEGLALQAAAAGQGVALASIVLARDELQCGKLVQPCGPLLDGEIYYLISMPEMMSSLEVSAVRDWILDCVL
jgi:LysR family glycine cleavage system transcriptional activator